MKFNYNNLDLSLLWDNILNTKRKIKAEHKVSVVRLTRVSNRTKTTFVYSHISYNIIFMKALLIYLTIKPNFYSSILYKEFVDYAGIIDENLCNTVDDRSYFKNFTKNSYASFNYNKEDFNNTKNKYIAFDYFKRGSYLMNYVKMSEFLNLTIKGDYEKIGTLINKPELNELFSSVKYKSPLEKSCVFLVADLEIFKTELENLGIILTTGKGKNKTNNNSLQHFLHLMDQDFRNNLYNITKSTHYSGKNFNRSDFSYQNIHNRCGGVRYYTTSSSRRGIFFGRSNTTADGSKGGYDFITNLLKNIDYKSAKSNEEKQMVIELTTLDGFIDNEKVKNNIVGDINTKILSPRLAKYIENNKEHLEIGINRLKERYKQKDNLESIIMNKLDAKYLYNITIAQFLNICTYERETDDDKMYGARIIINLGDKFVNKYFSLLKSEYKTSDLKVWLGFKTWLNSWIEDNREFYDKINNDTFKLGLAAPIIDILIDSNMIKKVVVSLSHDDKKIVLKVSKSDLLDEIGKSIYRLPNKLPMLCKPKDYSEDSYGGYLINDEGILEDIFIKKSDYQKTSEIYEQNSIYSP